MEALAEDALGQFDHLGLTPSYDPASNNFASDRGVPVRQVSGKRIPSRGDSDKFDVFTGIIDGVTGEPLYGTRHFAATGELYEGKFRTGGLRHGDSAIVKNIHIPPPRETLPNEFEELATVESSTTNLSFTRANFYGTYANDEPVYGTLVTDTYTYRGHFQFGRFHGLNGELIHSNGFRYKGEFQDGLFHGMGRELQPQVGEYQGEYRTGLKHGMGTFKEGPPEKKLASTTTEENTKETYCDHDWDSDLLGDVKRENNAAAAADDDDDGGHDEPLEGPLGDGKADGNEKGMVMEEEEKEGDDNKMEQEKVMAEEKQQEQEREQKAETPPRRYTYSGYFQCNLRQGEGTEWTTDGEVYSGQFLANRRHGHGSLRILQSNITFEGKWRAAEPIDGNGWRILYPNGDVYCGHAVKLLPHGYGMFKHHDGNVYSGDWLNGRRHGNGIHADPNGTEFTGEWKNDRIVSKKRLEETDGTLCEIAEVLRIENDKNADENEGESRCSVSVSEPLERNGSNKRNRYKELEQKREEEARLEGAAVDEGNDLKYEKQLEFLKKAMAKSIETSLHILTQNISEDNKEPDPPPPKRIPRSRMSDSSKSRHQQEPEKKKDPKAELHTYSNGDTYLGAFDPVTFHRTGYGVYVSKATGCTYTGQFRANLRHGYGILIHNQFGRYAGDFQDDKKHGLGTLILSDSSSYHGGFANGAFEGKGTLCERNGTVYVGEWRAGLRNGEGMETMSDGRVYKGRFRNGKREGNGTLLEKSAGKVIYRGHWRDGKYSGEGLLVERMAHPNVNQTTVVKWEGGFTNGQKHGYGVLTNETDGSEWKGVWSHGKPVSGKWRITYSDGGVYSGQARVLDDKDFKSEYATDKVVAVPDGFGTFKYANGDVYAGTFEFGIRSGSGTCQFASGEQWDGSWSNDHLDKDGNGILTMSDGSKHEFNGGNKRFFPTGSEVDVGATVKFDFDH